MCLVSRLKKWNDFPKLMEDFIVPGHVSGENTSDNAFSHCLERLFLHISEDIGVWILENTEGNGTMMIFEWGNVVIAKCELRLGINLKDH